MDKTAREFQIIFDAHEKRDTERFQEGKESLKEALDDVSTAIQSSSTAIMNEIKHITESVGEVRNDINGLKKTVDGLELYRAGKEGSTRILSYIGLFVASVVIGFLGWTGAQITAVKSDVQGLKNTLSAYNIEVLK